MQGAPLDNLNNGGVNSNRNENYAEATTASMTSGKNFYAKQINNNNSWVFN